MTGVLAALIALVGVMFLAFKRIGRPWYYVVVAAVAAVSFLLTVRAIPSHEQLEQLAAEGGPVARAELLHEHGFDVAHGFMGVAIGAIAGAAIRHRQTMRDLR
jgi:hypothetical protein